MAAHAVGADQHQRAQAGDGGGADLFARQRRGWRWQGARLRPGWRGRRGGGSLVTIGFEVMRRPGGAGGLLQHGARVVVQRAEQLGEGRIDRTGVGRPSRILLTEEGRIRPTESGGKNIDASHSL